MLGSQYVLHVLNGADIKVISITVFLYSSPLSPNASSSTFLRFFRFAGTTFMGRFVKASQGLHKRSLWQTIIGRQEINFIKEKNKVLNIHVSGCDFKGGVMTLWISPGRRFCRQEMKSRPVRCVWWFHRYMYGWVPSTKDNNFLFIFQLLICSLAQLFVYKKYNKLLSTKISVVI